MNNRNLSFKKAKLITEKLFKKSGINKSVYQPVIEGLLTTSLRGVDSHGIRLVPHYIRAALIGRINKKPRFSFKKTSLTTGILDADHGYGITAGTFAMNKAINMAEKSGVGIVVVKNSSHFGAAAIYSLLAAKKNMIGLSFTSVDSLVVPYGGKKAFLGTNPICFAAPMQNEGPFCLDMATTTISWNKLLMHREKNLKLEAGLVVNNQGSPTTNPNEAIALMPIGFYKGYGLGMMVEILCSLLSGMPFGQNIARMYPLDKKKRYLGHFFMAIDIKRFQPIEKFKKRLKKMVDDLRKQPCAKGFKKVLVSGDPEKKVYKERIKNGIPLTKEIVREFNKLTNELKIKI